MFRNVVMRGLTVASVLVAALPAASDDLFVLRYEPTLIDGYADIDLNTCQQLSIGRWTVESEPKYGEVSFSIETGPVECGGIISDYAFAVLSYVWTSHTNTSLRDTFDATYRDSRSSIPIHYHIAVAAVRPSGETSDFLGFSGTIGERTAGMWKQTLKPPTNDPTFSFVGESTQEADPGGGGPDKCWFRGSTYKPFTSISGGRWPVTAGNVWGADYVGWIEEAVKYYRDQNRAPCATTFPQQMTIKSPSETTYTNYGGINLLGAEIETNSVSSMRAGQEFFLPWP